MLCEIYHLDTKQDKIREGIIKDLHDYMFSTD